MPKRQSSVPTLDEHANGSDSAAIEALSELSLDLDEASTKTKQAKAKAPGAGRKPGVITGEKLTDRLDRGAAKWIYIEQAKYVRGLMAGGMSEEQAFERVIDYARQHIRGVLNAFHPDGKMESAGATYFGTLAPSKTKASAPSMEPEPAEEPAPAEDPDEVEEPDEPNELENDDDLVDDMEEPTEESEDA